MSVQWGFFNLLCRQTYFSAPYTTVHENIFVTNHDQTHAIKKLFLYTVHIFLFIDLRQESDVCIIKTIVELNNVLSSQ